MPNSQEVALWRLFFYDDVGYNPCCAIKLERQQLDKGVARFICVLGEYLSEEVFWTQINTESLTRPSALAMVGGRCNDDLHQGRVVELFSSEGSSLSSEVVVWIWGGCKYQTFEVLFSTAVQVASSKELLNTGHSSWQYSRSLVKSILT